MVDTVKSRIFKDGTDSAGFLFTNKSDGTGETEVVKIDASELNFANTNPIVDITICSWYISSGKSVEVMFDGTPNSTAIILTGSGSINFTRGTGEIKNDANTPTGDILFSTIGFANNDIYSILLEVKKRSGFDN